MTASKLHLGSRRHGQSAAMAARVHRRGERLKRWLTAGASVAIVAAMGWGLYWSLTSSYFQVDRIEIRGFRYLEQETVAARIRDGLGENLWRLDLSALTDSLQVLPWIGDARLNRRPPGTLTVDIREWRPTIFVAGDDDTGRAILLGNGDVAEFPEHLPIPDLPVLVGYEADADSAAVHASAVLDILEAVELTDLGTGTFLEFVTILEDGYSVVLGPGQQRLLLGREAFAERLRRYRAVAEEIPALAEIDLRFQGQVFIRDKS